MNGDMRYGRCGCSTMPMLSPGGNQTIAGANLLDRTTLALHPTATRGDISVWPNGCVCQAMRAPGSNVTLAPAARAGAFA